MLPESATGAPAAAVTVVAALRASGYGAVADAETLTNALIDSCPAPGVDPLLCLVAAAAAAAHQATDAVGFVHFEAAAAVAPVAVADKESGDLARHVAASMCHPVLPQKVLSAVMVAAVGLYADAACHVAGAGVHAAHTGVACQPVDVLAAAVVAGGCQPGVLTYAGVASLCLPVLLHQALLGCQCEHLEDGRLLQLAAGLQHRP